MSNDPAESGEGADDLLGRWLAHHDHATDTGAAAPSHRIPLAARPSDAAAPRTRLSASAALAELHAEPTVDRHDGPGQPSPVGFEPVILRSVRKKSELTEEPDKKDRRSRLSKLRSRANGPAEQPDPPEVEQPPPAAAPRKLVPYEDMVALATTASLPVTEPEPEVEPLLPGPDTEPTPVVPQPEPQPEVEPVLPGPDTEPTPVVPQPEPDPQPEPGTDTIRRLLSRTKPPKARPPVERKRRPLVARHAAPATTGTGGAARGLLAAARAATPAPELASSHARPAPPKIEPVPMLPVETVVETPARSAPAMEMPAVYEFAPRRTARRFLSLMFIVGLAASGYLGYAAYLSRHPIDIGIAGIVTLATMVIWAIRAGATITRLTVRRGQLEITRQGGRQVFDLASTYTSIQVVGKPGSKKWKVQFLRTGMAPVVVDSTMVDGRDFMRILTFFRPEVAVRDH